MSEDRLVPEAVDGVFSHAALLQAP
jgi:hypothetical protein